MSEIAGRFAKRSSGRPKKVGVSEYWQGAVVRQYAHFSNRESVVIISESSIVYSSVSIFLRNERQTCFHPMSGRSTSEDQMSPPALGKGFGSLALWCSSLWS